MKGGLVLVIKYQIVKYIGRREKENDKKKEAN